ncbi:MAG: DUF2141 domain-containing protein [Pseudomonadota bacterium]
MNASIRITVALLASALFAASAQAATLTITVTEIEQTEGFVMIALFDSAAAYENGGEAIRGLRVAVEGAEVTTEVEGLEPGDYAIKLYHDANGNGTMDMNPVGIPLERYGFSGNKGRFGAPPFAKAAFTVAEAADNETLIKLR